MTKEPDTGQRRPHRLINEQLLCSGYLTATTHVTKPAAARCPRNTRANKAHERIVADPSPSTVDGLEL